MMLELVRISQPPHDHAQFKQMRALLPYEIFVCIASGDWRTDGSRWSHPMDDCAQHVMDIGSQTLKEAPRL